MNRSSKLVAFMNEQDLQNLSLSQLDADPQLRAEFGDFVIKNAIREAYQKSFRLDLAVLLTILLSLISLFGTVSNLLVFAVLSWDKNCLEMQSNNNNGSRSSVKSRTQKKHKRSIGSNSLLHLLIRFLSLVDLLICSIAVPGTIFETWRYASSNEFVCRLLEQIRATGVLLSNFIVIMIAVERYFLICKPTMLKSFKKLFFKLLVYPLTGLSVLMGIFNMLDVSVYQRFTHKIVYVGICLRSNLITSEEWNKGLQLTVTALVIACAFIVGFIYSFILMAAFEVNQKRTQRHMEQDRILNRIKINIEPAKEKFAARKSIFIDPDLLQIEPSERSLSSDNLTSNIDTELPDWSGQQQSQMAKKAYYGSFKLERVKKSRSELLPSNGNRSKLKRKSLSECCLNVDANIRQCSEQRRRRLLALRYNIRMSFIVFLVTLAYYISIIPWCLTINNLIKFNPFIYYTFLLNNCLNPIIYSFLNENFRRSCIEFLRLLFTGSLRTREPTV
nr:G protein-coupled receptor [Proales similis]